MSEIIVFCFPRTGSSVFGKWLTDANYVDLKEIYALEYNFNILSIPESGEATTEEYINHCNSIECLECCDFETKVKKTIDAFKLQKTPDKFLYKMFLGWHAHYCQQPFYTDYIKDKTKILLIRKDFVDWVSSIALQNHNKYFGHQTNNEQIFMQYSDKLLNDLFFGFQILLEFVDSLDYIILYEDAIKNKLADKQLSDAFGIKQNFDNHVSLIDNPFSLKEKYVKNFDKFIKVLREQGYQKRYEDLLATINEKYVVNGNAVLIGTL